MADPVLKRRDISLGSLYIKYFRMIAGSISLMIIITIIVISVISSNIQNEALDAKSAQALTLIQSSVDSVLSDTSTQANKLAYTNEIVQLRLKDRDYTHDYEALMIRLNSLRFLRMAQRANMDYNVSVYVGVNDYVVSSKYGAQKRQYVYDSEMADVYAKYQQLGENQFFVRRDILTSRIPETRRPVLSYFFGIDDNDFIVMDIDIVQLRSLLSGGPASGGVAFIMDDAGNYIAGTDEDWLNSYFDEIYTMGALSEDMGDCRVDDSYYRVYVSHSTTTPMSYVMLVPYEIRWMATRAFVSITVIVLLIGLVMSLVLAWYVSKRVFRPIGVILDFVNSKGSDTPEKSGSYEVEYILFNILEAYQKNTRLEKEQLAVFEQMRYARVRALQQQMTPHFLYNTLQAIMWMSLEDMGYQESRSSQSIKSLSNMARFCMEGGTVEVEVREEISYVEEYLRLMKLRYGDKISWEVMLPEETAHEKIPRLSVQPLVENAVKHSLSKIENGWVRITVGRQQNALVVSVRDSGPGMSEEEMTQLNHEFEKEFTMNDRHIALMNLNQRLKLIYGAGSGLYVRKADGMMEIAFRIVSNRTQI